MRELIKKYREILSYLFFGVATTVVNWAVYALFVGMLGVNLNVGNFIAWIAAVIFAYVTNKIWVFKSTIWRASFVIGEFLRFASGRLITGVFEMLALPLLVSAGINQTLFGVEGFVAKILVSIVVIILNYIFSKLFVFRRKKR